MDEFNFEQYRAAREASRQAIRSTLTRLFNCGLTVFESNGGGIQKDWTIYNHQSETIRRIHAVSLSGPAENPHPVFVPDPRYNSPAYLAEHLENRSFGFGWELSAYCVDCGENLIPIAEVTDDPVCPVCEAKRIDRLHENINEP